MTDPVFITRCRVSGKKIETEWGREVHSESRRSLAEHIVKHTFSDLQDFAFRSHFGSSIQTRSASPPIQGEKLGLIAIDEVAGWKEAFE